MPKAPSPAASIDNQITNKVREVALILHSLACSLDKKGRTEAAMKKLADLPDVVAKMRAAFTAQLDGDFEEALTILDEINTQLGNEQLVDSANEKLVAEVK